MAHGLQARDLIVGQRALFVLDHVGQVLMVVARILDDLRGAHPIQIIERAQDHHADDVAAAGRADDHQALRGLDEARRHAGERALVRRDRVLGVAHQAERFGVPGLIEKSSMVLLSSTPVLGTM